MAEIIRDPNNGNDNQRNRQSLFQSFANAWNGFVVCFKEERNIKIHCFAAVMVLIFGNILHISVTEWLICFLLFGLIMGMAPHSNPRWTL